ncbi:hypothetical protein H4J02_12865 [Protaetiibacter sp. SSC-01]|uniref:hypothetical protein n=1 Tax=Protaetiibacter sp. SSC-01 TaxID=2759943 RepID=UPI00165711DF|nr:hypothetical protein [Protaetiibacter sp. SSC-01]QNO37309.1 hypothetical protein H4J02_12865 [Protaetiibacter sp. SSC-01]
MPVEKDRPAGGRMVEPGELSAKERSRHLRPPTTSIPIIPPEQRRAAAAPPEAPEHPKESA